MDPKLKYFLDATGWSKQDLIQQLSAGEKKKSAASTETDCVSSTTSYISNPTHPKTTMLTLPPFTASLLRQLQKLLPQTSQIQPTNKKTSKHVIKNVEAPKVDLESTELPPDSTDSLFSDDMLLHLNTTSSYLPPLYNLESPKRTTVLEKSTTAKAAVVESVSDVETVEPPKDTSVKQEKDEEIIDICSDSEGSVKDSKSLFEQVSDGEDPSSLAKNSKLDRLQDRARGSSSRSLPRRYRSGSDRESSRDRSRHRERRHRHRDRSSSSNNHREDRQHRKAVHHSRSRTRRHKSRDEWSKSRSRSRRRSRSSSLAKQRSKRSRSSRSNSKSADGDYKNRKRSRSRSCEKKQKVHKTSDRCRARRKAAHSPDDSQKNSGLTSYYGKDLSPNAKDSDIPPKATKALKNGTCKKRCLLHAKSNVSESRSQSHTDAFKNTANEEALNPSKIKFKLKRHRNKSLEAKTADVTDQSGKRFIESKDRNLTSEGFKLSKDNKNTLETNEIVEIDEDQEYAEQLLMDPITTNAPKVETNIPKARTNVFDSDKSKLSNTISNKMQLNITEHAWLSLLNAEKSRLEQELIRETTGLNKITNIDTVSLKDTVPNNTQVTSPKLVAKTSCKDKITPVQKLLHPHENFSDISDCTSDDLVEDAIVASQKKPNNTENMCSPTTSGNMLKNHVSKNVTIKSNIFDLGNLSDISDCTAGDLTDDTEAVLATPKKPSNIPLNVTSEHNGLSQSKHIDEGTNLVEKIKNEVDGNMSSLVATNSSLDQIKIEIEDVVINDGNVDDDNVNSKKSSDIPVCENQAIDLVLSDMVISKEDSPSTTDVVSPSQVPVVLEGNSEIPKTPANETETASKKPSEDLTKPNPVTIIGSPESQSVPTLTMKSNEDVCTENVEDIKSQPPITEHISKTSPIKQTENLETVSAPPIVDLCSDDDEEFANPQLHKSAAEDISKSICPSDNIENSSTQSVDDEDVLKSIPSENNTYNNSTEYLPEATLDLSNDSIQLIVDSEDEDIKPPANVETLISPTKSLISDDTESNIDKTVKEESDSEDIIMKDDESEEVIPMEDTNKNTVNEVVNQEVEKPIAQQSMEEDEQNQTGHIKDSNECIGTLPTENVTEDCLESCSNHSGSNSVDHDIDDLLNEIESIHESLMNETYQANHADSPKEASDCPEDIDSMKESNIEVNETTEITEAAAEVYDEDTPSLDIEAILRKCKDDQDKALNKSPEDKLPSSVVRLKNRRPNFSSFRDKSVSTIHINKLLEKLSQNKDDSDCSMSKDSFVKSCRIGEAMEKLKTSAKSKNIKQKPAFSNKSNDTTQVEETADLVKPPSDKVTNDDVRVEILKQLEMLRNQTNNTAFSTSINPVIAQVVRKKTLAKLRDPITEDDDDDEDEINIVNENLDYPIIWLTKTTDYKKIKGWKAKSLGIKTKKSSAPVAEIIAEDFAVPSCSFHYPSFVDDIIENVVADNSENTETESTDSMAEPEESEEAERNAFSSSVLEEFLLDKTEMELKISFEVPKLLMGPKINPAQKVQATFLKDGAKYSVESLSHKEVPIKEVTKPRTLAEKRKLLVQETQNYPVIEKPKAVVQEPAKVTFSTSLEVFRNPQRNTICIRRSVSDDMPNTGHNKRKDFSVGSVYCKGKKYVVPCRERKAIYFRSKISSRYSQLHSNNPSEEVVTKLNVAAGNLKDNEEPPKAILWSPEKIIPKPMLQSILNQRKDIVYKAGPMCKKPELLLENSPTWKCIVKPLPKVFLEITAEYGKALHPRALQFLHAASTVDLSKEKVEFALTALKDSEPTKYRIPVLYEKGELQLTLRELETIKLIDTKIPPICSDISIEVKEVVNDLLNCLEIQDMQDSFIKDDPDVNTHPLLKQRTKSSSSTNSKDNPLNRNNRNRIIPMNRKLRLALGQLQVKFIDINIDEDQNCTQVCEKLYCTLGCICTSLVGALPSKEHCRRIECVFGCICGYKPPINTTVTIPAGSDMDLFTTVDKLQTEATKNLAKVEREFTQTIVCTKNETYVLGDTLDRRRRCTRAPKKYGQCSETKEIPIDPPIEELNIFDPESIRNTYGVHITECSVQIEKVDMYHIIPFCWQHELYQCECLKEFLLARSQEKANNLALQLESVDANSDNDDGITIQGLLGSSKWNKTYLQKKIKKLKRKFTQIKRHQLKLQAAKAAGTIKPIKIHKARHLLHNTLNAPEQRTTDIIIPHVDLTFTPNVDNSLAQDNQQSKSISRRKQVLSTMVDVSEKATIQVRKVKEPIVPKKGIITKPVQTFDPDLLKFLLPTGNVRLQFLRMLGKPEDAKDEFRLLSFMVLSNRFHRRMFNVWYSRSSSTSKYILSMNNSRPSPDFINVRLFRTEMKTDNYLIQWLMEGTIPVTEVQDFLVILRVIDNTRFEICGMCEKSKIEYIDEPVPSLHQTLPVITPPVMPVVPTMAYNVHGAARHERKILNIQNKKIPTISCTYASVALTGQTGLFHASLPSINANYRWLMLSFSSTFAVLNMTTTNYCIPHEYLVEIIEQCQLTNSTIMFKNRDIRGRAPHSDFAIYVTPQHKKYIFIGPYHLNEDLSCETLCYYKNMLVSTENFNKIHGNPETPVGSWIKQLQMKIHTINPVNVSPQKTVQVALGSTVSNTTPLTTIKVSPANIIQTPFGGTIQISSVKPVSASSANTIKIPIGNTIKVHPANNFMLSSINPQSPNTINFNQRAALLKPILPKAPTSSPPQLLRISDFMAAKKGQYSIVNKPDQLMKGSPKTSLLIVNNKIVSSASIAVGNITVTGKSIGGVPLPTSVNPSSAVSCNVTSASTTTVVIPPSRNDSNDLPNSVSSEDIRLLGLDYRDAEFKDTSDKTLQYLVTNIPGFGYIRIYRCHKTNAIYLMWRFMKMYKTLMEAKNALILLIENTVIVVPSNFKIAITLLSAKPSNIKIINSDYYFDTYIAGRFGIHLLSNLSKSAMVDYLKLDETDVAYVKEKSSSMLLKKCYNIASTFLTKDDLSKIRNWRDMMSALKGTIDTERDIATKLADELRVETHKQMTLQSKLDSLQEDYNDMSDVIHVTPVKATSDVIEISDDDKDNDDSEVISKVVSEGQNPVTPTLISSPVGDVTKSNLNSFIKTNTLPKGTAFLSMAQNFKGNFKLLPHKQNSVLITRIKNPPTTTNDT